jgi:hypothetical protein
MSRQRSFLVSVTRSSPRTSAIGTLFSSIGMIPSTSVNRTWPPQPCGLRDHWKLEAPDAEARPNCTRGQEITHLCNGALFRRRAPRSAKMRGLP